MQLTNLPIKVSGGALSGSLPSLTLPLTLRGKVIPPWLVFIAVMLGSCMASLATTIVNSAIPVLQTSLKADLTSVSWILNGYNLVYAVLPVTVGRLADQYGRKRLFLLGLLLLSLSSLGCACAEICGQISHTPAIAWLIGFRALQAIGAAILTSVSLAILLAVFPKERHAFAVGTWGVLAGLASESGPVLGGFLLQSLDWRWIFLVNLPVCIVSLFLVILFVPETRDRRASWRIDILGMLSLTAAVFCLVLALIEGNNWGWVSLPVLSLIGAALGSALLFVFVELKQAEPMVDLRLFKIRSFSGANITMFLFGIAVQGILLLAVLYLINAQGYSQLQAALAFLPMLLVFFAVSAVAGKWGHKISPHMMGLIGLVALAIGFNLFGLLSTDAQYADIMWRTLLIGAGMGLIYQSQPHISLSDVPRSKGGVGSGVFNTVRKIGLTLGVAILLNVFLGQLHASQEQARSDAIALVQADTWISPQVKADLAAYLSNVPLTDNAGKPIELSSITDTLPDRLPAQDREAVRAEIRALGSSIDQAFKAHLVNAYKAAWLFASMFAMLAFLTALFTLAAGQVPLRKAAHTRPLPEGIYTHQDARVLSINRREVAGTRCVVCQAALPATAHFCGRCGQRRERSTR
jgi:EmrB/QacA subfamily drug resistance transporter